MSQTFKLNREELEFLLNTVPAYGALNGAEKPMFLRIMGLLASKPPVFSFYFPKQDNDGNAVPVIKLIRAQTGWGLKEAKDAWDAEQRFTLTQFKLSKEALLEMCSSVVHTSKAIKVIFE